jgi:hypothetical protein
VLTEEHEAGVTRAIAHDQPRSARNYRPIEAAREGAT